jgi:peptidoglycan biosynthesis protein MviN/MurJ (putative lipid II flippase)
MGIALGGAVGAWLNLLLLWGSLSRRLGGLFQRAAVLATVRLGFASLAAAGAGLLARGWLVGRLPADGFLPAVALLLGIAAAGAVPYLLIARRPPRVAGEGVGGAD